MVEISKGVAETDFPVYLFSTELEYSDYKKIKDSRCLNSTAISFIYDYLENNFQKNNDSIKILFLSPLQTTLILSTDDFQDLQQEFKKMNFKADFIFAVIVDKEQNINVIDSKTYHWTLLLIDKNQNSFYLNSLNSDYVTKNAKELGAKVLGLKNNNYQIFQGQIEPKIVQNLPQQNNGIDCGMFVCAYTEKILDYFISQNNIQNFDIQNCSNLQEAKQEFVTKNRKVISTILETMVIENRNQKIISKKK